MSQRKKRRIEPKFVFLIGAGHRGKHLLNILLKRNSNFQILGIYDPNEEAIETAKSEYPETKHITTDINYIDRFIDQVDLWMVCSTNEQHLEHCRRITKKNAYVFCEKPLCIDRVQLDGLMLYLKKYDINFMTGFVLRHAPFYQKIRELSGQIGNILNMRVVDDLYHGHGGFIMSNWRRFQDKTGGHLVEKCVHVIDLINWFMGDDVYPMEVTTYGKTDIWTNTNKKIGNLLIKKYKDKNLFKKFKDYETHNPFDCKKTILHASSSIIRYSNNALVSFDMNTFNPGSVREFTVIGMLGRIEAKWENGSAVIKYTIKGRGKKDTEGVPEETMNYNFGPTNCHGNADNEITDYLARSVMTNTCNLSDFPTAYKSMLTSIALEESYANGETKKKVYSNPPTSYPEY